jgi:hypothetical protein
MINAVPVTPNPSTTAERAVEQNAKPAFELILSGLEATPPGEPFKPEQVKLLNGLNRAAREHYSRILNGMLGADIGAPGLPTAVMRGAQMLHRRLANALGQASLRLALRPRPALERTEVAALAVSSLCARAEEIKWHAFERTTPHSSSWQNTNALFLGIESLGLDRELLDDGRNCAEAFVQCILLATLNVGIFSAPQMELAHRWLSVSAQALRIEPFFDPETHWYQIDLERAQGPERISPDSAVSDSTRFLAVSTLGSSLAQARAKLYAGELSVGATPNRIVAIHFGAFLDLAERLWSPDWRRATWRASRTAAKGDSIEVVIGYDGVVAVLASEDDSADAAKPQASWALRDTSNSGMAALVPEPAGVTMQPGALIAYRTSDEFDWEIGSIVRRVRSVEETHWLIGIKRISDAPVTLRLESSYEVKQPDATAPRDPLVIYAPIETGGNRIDSLLLSVAEFARNASYKLPTRSGAFRIKLNRVIDRGDNWVRVGFEVLGKQ